MPFRSIPCQSLLLAALFTTRQGVLGGVVPGELGLLLSGVSNAAETDSILTQIPNLGSRPPSSRIPIVSQSD